MGKNKQINISFKNTTKDMQLYTVINSLEEKSETIKQILYKALIEKREFK
ncbi:hypothetical protein [Clostridium sp.]|uniref:Uncharacterized protein n=1 Tax=Clostridium butyricum TaxID=1492 RepID=A0A6N3FEN8_CLOBU|nr:hypothetical protein [Clostridium sp.]MDU7260702.1 hypothetical protein [Clostridium butyricum]MDU1068154.1 hypothetical protein [Clostridium sp.]MDU2679728.1 hypothetical protein [Clostridium sp.]MDU4211909.1 hypothetical protein [Clostridium sp.]MDU5175068.1 hypothetical protein [Clostridium sp.]